MSPRCGGRRKDDPADVAALQGQPGVVRFLRRLKDIALQSELMGMTRPGDPDREWEGSQVMKIKATLWQKRWKGV